MEAIEMVRTNAEGHWYISNSRTELFLKIELAGQFCDLNRQATWERIKPLYDRYVLYHPDEAVDHSAPGALEQLLRTIAAFEVPEISADTLKPLAA